jgi:proteasome lid subunit RPN8/RPN11
VFHAEFAAQMLAHFSRCNVFEGGGLLSGYWTPGAVVAVTFHGGRNIDASRARYTMDPDDVRRAFDAMALQGASLVAVAHSHLTSHPEPSQHDLVEARLPEVLNVILGFEPEVQFRAWRFRFAGAEHAVATCEVPPVSAMS